MIIGLGSDIVDVRRIADVIDRHGEHPSTKSSPRPNAAKPRDAPIQVETYAKRSQPRKPAPKLSVPACGAAFSGVIWASSIF